MKNIFLLFILIFSYENFAQKNDRDVVSLKEIYNSNDSKTFIEKGNLSVKKIKKMRKAISKELNFEILENSPIVVTFYQKDGFCLQTSSKEDFLGHVLNNAEILSKERVSKFKSQEFFIFTDDILFKNQFEKRSKFFLDKGFFKNKIFKENINCHAYYVLKPNGDYLLYYVSDGSSFVLDFLEE